MKISKSLKDFITTNNLSFEIRLKGRCIVIRKDGEVICQFFHNDSLFNKTWKWSVGISHGGTFLDVGNIKSAIKVASKKCL